MRKEDVGRSKRLFDSATNVDRLLQNERLSYSDQWAKGWY